jgi:hypothetical protein
MSQGLNAARSGYPPQLHVTPALGMDLKTEPGKDGDNVVAGEPSKPGHRLAPTPWSPG